MKTGHKYTARASREVILSAGAVQSPQLLELSGIGNKTLLAKLGIESRIDNPMVGENYQYAFFVCNVTGVYAYAGITCTHSRSLRFRSR